MFSFLRHSGRQSATGARLLSLLLFASCLWEPSTASAQAPWTWYPAINPDYSVAGGNAGAVANTGCAQVGLAGQVLRVMCWDKGTGSITGSLGWSFSPNATPGNQGTIPFGRTLPGQDNTPPSVALPTRSLVDPDVVADPTHADSRFTTTNVLVTYTHRGRGWGSATGVFYEVLAYDSRTNTMTALGPPVQVSPLSERPNVDVDTEGNAVITWQESGSIYAMVYNLPSQTAYPVCEIASDPRYYLSQPDVAVFDKSRKATSFIYLATDGSGNQSVRMNQVPRMMIERQPSVSSGAGTDIYPRGSGQYEAPRIAAPINWPGIEEFDFEAVVYETNTNNIVMLSNDAQQYPVDIAGPPVAGVLNEGGHMNQVLRCSSPVVTHAGDGLIVCWTIEDDPARPLRNGTREVVQTSMNWGGVANPGYLRRDAYSIVNLKENGDQLVVSVDGRFSPLPTLGSSNLSSNALYCFYDNFDNDIYYKVARYNERSLRTGAAAPAPADAPQPVAAYPNPFRTATTLTLALAKNEAVQRLEIYDPMGQPVRGLKLPFAQADGTQQVRWEAADLKPGIYQVRVHTSAGHTYTYRVQHE